MFTSFIATTTSLGSFSSSSPSSSFVATAIIDATLIFFTIFNLVVGIVPRVLPSYFAYKKSLLKTQFHVIQTFHSIPLMVTFAKATLFLITIYYMIQTTMNYNNDEDNDVDSRTLYYYTYYRAIISGITFVCTLLLISLGDTMLLLGLDRVLEMEQEIDMHGIINFKPVPKQVARTFMKPITTLLQTECHGLENVPPGGDGSSSSRTSQASLFVMNHSLMGLEMAPFVNTLYQEKDIFVRGLADHFHFASPHGHVLREVFGAVDGTRENVDILMSHNQNVLVYPGGGHEILKHSSVPKCKLLWKERLGFARMAIKYGYPIIPCAAVGTEDMLDIMCDIPIDFIRKDLSLPVVSFNPKKLQNIYFWFGTPISTTQYNGDYTNDTYAKQVRDQVKSAVELGIQQMKQQQQNDPNRYYKHQFANKLMLAKQHARNVLSSAISNTTTTEASAVSTAKKEENESTTINEKETKKTM